MDLEYLNLIFFPVFTTLILISILGYGTIINNVTFKDKIELSLKNLIFIQGLIFSGFIFMFLNFFIPISNYLTIVWIIGGSFFYIFYLFKNKEIKNELIFILFVLVLSIIYSFYSGFNDDFNYHYDTIKNYKEKNLFEILHHRRISYNSHWLFLNSIYTLSFFSSTLFILSSLFFSISVYDFTNLSRTMIQKNKHYLSIISFFCLIFFLGILTKLKDLGTDIPGVIVSIYIIILITNKIFEKSNDKINNIFLITLLFCQFAIIIKISNALVFLFLILLFFKIRYRELNYYLFFLICIIPMLWLFQNYVISGCLVWPITITCFSNTDLAINEIYIIESFAKGDQSASMKLNNLNWIIIWFENHSTKMLETYFIYLVILLFPFIYIYFNKKDNKALIINFLKNIYFENNYKFLLLLIFICNLIWFFFAPAYRFGIFYNLFIIIFLSLPLWLYMIKNNFQFILKYSRIILIIVFIYFIFENIIRLDWYMERYDIWPPINQGELLERKEI